MKNYILLAIIAIATFTGCQKDCGQWYEKDGKDCVSMREKFYGTYLGVLTVNGNSQNTATVLEPHTDESKMIWDSDLYVVLTGSETFEIPLQQQNDNGTIIYIQGSGSISGNQLGINFGVTVNNVSSPGSFVGTRQ